MKVYIFRHAMAAFGAKSHSDDPAVTKEGASDTGRVVELARDKLGFKPNVIASSPLVRAKQTAELAREILGSKTEVVVDGCLYGDRRPADVIAFLSKFKKTDRVALVSHMPLIFELLYDLIGGRAEIELLNGSIACVDFAGMASSGRGKLIWLVQPS
jgi:phosphohistidine phosphatase